MGKYVAVYKTKISVDGIETIKTETQDFDTSDKPSAELATRVIKNYIAELNRGRNIYQFIELVTIRKAGLLDKLKSNIQQKQYGKWMSEFE
jgi:hypothetical protein